MDERTRRTLIGERSSIRDAMAAIDSAALGLALIVDASDELLGVVTDGDVRRAILRGLALDLPVAGIMQRSPVTVPPGTATREVRRLFLESGVRHLPVVDSARRVLDILTVSELLTVPLSHPDIGDREIDAVLGVLRTPNLSLGPKLAEFERRVAEYAERKHAIAVSSGTAGLHLVVRAVGIADGDEVVTTPFSFIASSNCVLYERARPVFVDIDPVTYNIDPNRIEAAITPRTRAILVVDVFGQPAEYEAIEAIARRHDVALIVDSCESIGAEYRGGKASRHGLAGVFAFYPNKQVTTGEGGVIVTDDDDVAYLCRSMRNQGREEGAGWLAHGRLGYNYRLPDISCALGIVQLERIEDTLRARERVARTYTRLLGALPEVHAPIVAEATTRMSWFVYVVRLADGFTREDRDRVMRSLKSDGIGASNYFPPIHLQPFYREQFGFHEGDFPITEHVAARTIALPFHNNVTETECEEVVRRLRAALETVSAKV
jgi:perosamine synthetase